MEKVKNKTKIFLPVILVFAFLVSIFSFAGCGTNIGTLSENLKKMNDELLKYSEVIAKNESEINTQNYYSFSYGTVIDGILESGNAQETFVELDMYFSPIFSLSMSYVDFNLSIITNLKDEEMNDKTKDSLNDLNQKVVDFNNEIVPFVSARNDLASYFYEYGQTEEENEVNVANDNELRAFKREYAKFVDKAVQLSLSLKNAVEATGDLENTENVMLVKNSILNEILPVFHNFLVMDIGTFNWQESKVTETKTTILSYIDSLIENLNTFIQIFQTNEGLKVLDKTEIKNIENLANNFMTEVQDYNIALQNLNIENLAVHYSNEMGEYLKDNKNAMIYLEKINQFVNNTLPTYLANLSASII